jgi:hypothetical protein
MGTGVLLYHSALIWLNLAHAAIMLSGAEVEVPSAVLIIDLSAADGTEALQTCIINPGFVKHENTFKHHRRNPSPDWRHFYPARD